MIANKTAVLYVDDNAKSGRLLATVFRICGCQVVTAADPVETLRHSRRLCFDLELVDYHLPVLSGSELAKKIKSMHSVIPIVTISSWAVLRDIDLLFVDACAVKRRWTTAGESPARELGSLHPEAIRAAVEETKPSEPLV